jgi:hypothetical protein
MDQQMVIWMDCVFVESNDDEDYIQTFHYHNLMIKEMIHLRKVKYNLDYCYYENAFLL